MTLSGGAKTTASRPPALPDSPRGAKPFDATLLETTIPARFALAVAAHGERLAIKADGASISYRELDRQSDRIAGALAGVSQPGDAVVVLLPNGTGSLASALGVLKSGCFFIGLSTSDPAERLREQIAHTRASIVLTDRDHAALLNDREPPSVTLLNLDALPPGHAPSGTRPVTADALCHVVYTSGSTGAPKAVLHTHRNILFNAACLQQALNIQPDDRMTLFGSLAGGASTSQALCALLAGAAIFPFNLKANRPRDLAAWLSRERITVLHTVPAAFRQLARNLPTEQTFPHLRAVRLGGEQMRPIDLALFRRHFPRETVLVNTLGITEVGPVCSCRIDPQQAPSAPLPVGHPYPGRRLLVVDAEGRALPPGSCGELVVESRYLSSGYLHQPELMAARFRFDTEHPERSRYLTGDTAVLDEEGCCTLLGRQDQQAKISGQTVRAGEIENALLRHPSVLEAAVTLPQTTGLAHLVAAYIVADPDAPVTDRALLEHASRLLPPHKVPSILVRMSELPRTASRKVDHRALPPPEQAADIDAVEFPELEAALERVWKSVLGAGPASRYDNFLSLGGESLAAAELVDALSKALGQYVHMVMLHEAPTLAGQARYLATHYPEAVHHWLHGRDHPAGAPRRTPLTGELCAALDAWCSAQPQFQGLRNYTPPAQRLAPAVFILCPPRSGSTLLRAMLAGHPSLFAPPLLHLLPFTSMAGRRAAFAGEQAYRLEGLVRAFMALRGGDASRATRAVEQLEQDGKPTDAVLALLQEQLGERRLVDKSSLFALLPGVLRRMEEAFREARFIHLCRHPLGMVHSFTQGRHDQVVFASPPPGGVRATAEYLWWRCHENILAFLSSIPPERQYRVSFEQLTAAPRATMQQLCAALDLPFHEALLTPYDGRAARMTDGISANAAGMIGDRRFHEHQTINPAVAHRWTDAMQDTTLAAASRRIANTLGYAPAAPEHPVLAPLQAGRDRPPFFCVPGAGTDAFGLSDLADSVAPSQPFISFHARGLDGEGQPHQDVETIARHYLEAVHTVQPSGPYYLGGTSFGGLVAYEMAQQLRAAGERVGLLALLDTRAPGYPARKPVRGLRRRLLFIVRWWLPIGYRESITWHYLRLGIHQRWARFRARRALRRGRPIKSLSAMQRFACIVESSLRASRTYHPQPYAGDVTLFRAEIQPPAELFEQRPDLGWQGLVQGTLRVVDTPGRHGEHERFPHARRLGELIQQALDEATASRGPC